MINGKEAGGGTIRYPRSASCSRQVPDCGGWSGPPTARERFGFLLDTLQVGGYTTHGGIASGTSTGW